MRLPIAILFFGFFYHLSNAFSTSSSARIRTTKIDSPTKSSSTSNSPTTHQRLTTSIAPVPTSTEQNTVKSTVKTTTSRPTPAVPHPGDCNFDFSWCNWENKENDRKKEIFDWLRNRGRTKSSNTGPMADVAGRGYYAYIEASWPRRAGHVARLISPVLNGTQCMRFQYSMYGRYMGDLQIYIQEGHHLIFLWGRYRNQGIGWHSTNVTVYGVDYKILIVGRVGKSYTSDMAIDEISFVHGTCDGKPLFSVTSAGQADDSKAGVQEGEPGSCNFDSGYCDWIDVPLGDDFDWKLHRGKTGTTDTGPLVDHTGRNGNYLYIESSTPRRRGDVALLLSPRLCGTKCLRFYYHLYGAHMGRLTIYQRYGMGNDDRIWGASGDHGDGWHEAMIDISGNCYQIVIEGMTGSGYLGDAAIDDIIFTKGTCCSIRNLHVDVTKGNCSFDQGFCQWKNELKRDNFDWSLIDKATPSMNTGPKGPVSGFGQYAFVESSEPRLAGEKAILISPVLNGFVCLRFKYHMYGEDIGSLAVFKHGSGVHRKSLWYRKGNLGNLWRNATINIDCKESSFQIEIEAVTNGWRGDIAIDDIGFQKTRCNVTTDAPIVQDPVIPTTSPLYNGDCTFPNTFCEWKNDRDDSFDWEIGSADTPSFRTGPSFDVDGNGYYIFIEASSHRFRDKASLSSGIMTGRKCLTFHFHMYGKGMGILSVKIINVKSNYKHMVWYKSGNKGKHWIRKHLNIGYNDNYKVAFEGQRISHTGDIALDDISFKDGVCVDTKESSLLYLPVTTIKPTVPFEERLEDCTFDNNHMCKWVNLNKDDFDWKLWKGPTPSRGTGPLSGHGGKGKYIYAEASAPRKEHDKARIGLYRSPSISCMTFFYHMYGDDIDTLSLSLLSRTSFKVLWQKKGSQGKGWLRANLTITSSEKYQLIFEALVGDGFQSDMALDDIMFTDGICETRTPLPQRDLFTSSGDLSSTMSSLSIQGDCPDCGKAKT